MTIEVDCNRDIVIITESNGKECVLKANHPTEVIKILEEIFNSIPHSEFHNIILVKTDEDTRTTIGEW